jgi:hypothetical protein
MLKPTLAALLALSLPSMALACPTINGEFEKRLSAERSLSVGLTTKTEGGKYFYNFDVEAQAPFMEADGVAKKITHDGETGTIKVSCGDNWVSLEATQEGGPTMGQKYTLINPTQLQVESGDAEFNGVFTKK